MKEYIFLQAFYLRQGSLDDIDLLIEHIELQDVKTRLSKDFIRICLCLICYRCDVDQALWDLLSHPSIKEQLSSLEDAMFELYEKGFLINPALIYLLLDKSAQDKSNTMAPLSAGILLGQAKKLEFLSAENKIIAPTSFQDMDIKKIKLYAKLIEKSSLDIHVLKNTARSSSPTRDEEIEAYATIYYYATLCHCTNDLNSYFYKTDVLGIQAQAAMEVAGVLKKMHETNRLTVEIFFSATRLVSKELRFFLKTLNYLEAHAISVSSYCSAISTRHTKFRYKVEEFYHILMIIENAALTLIDNTLLKRLIHFDEKLVRVLQSLRYLEQRAALSSRLFFLMLDFYESEPKQSPPAKKPPYSYSSYQNFWAVKSTKPPSFEISAVLFALSEAALLQHDLTWINTLTVPAATFIQQLFWLGELTPSLLALARTNQFHSKYLGAITYLPLIRNLALSRCLSTL